MSVCCHISVCVCRYVTTCTVLHTHYMYISTYSLHVLVYIHTTCTCLHTHYMYLSTYSLHVLVYILTTCTCLHTHYMYLSTGVQSSCVNVPIKDQLTVYGELMIFTMTLYCLLMFSSHPLHSNRSDSIRYWIASCLGGGSKVGTPHQPWCLYHRHWFTSARGKGWNRGFTYLVEWEV